MRIKNIKLVNFRNHPKIDIDFGDITILKGPNGAGKTNILESIYMLSVCRSYRSRRDREVIRWCNHPNHPNNSQITPESKTGTGTARVSLEAMFDGGGSIDLALAQSGDKKVAFIKGVRVPISLLVGRLPSVLFAPEIMQLPYDAPSRRRRYLDIFLSELKPNYLSSLVKYHKILKSRNRLLERAYLKNINTEELVFWDKELSIVGSVILKMRQEAIKRIDEKLSTNLHKINGSNQKLRIKYHSTIEDVEKYGEALSARIDRDIREKSTTAGPHRDDWQLVIGGNDVREVSSRGEVRTVILALKMAEMEILHQSRDEMPVLLLDDVFAELDRKHSDALLDLIDGAQTIVTATDAEYIPKSIMERAKILDINPN